MHDPPGTIPPLAARHHPRRAPAHKSVSLRHSPPATSRAHQPTSLSSVQPASDTANPPSVSPKLLSNKYSSGESSDAGRWFETTNNNAQQSSASFADNEPPFFLRNSSSSETPPDGQSTRYGRARAAMPYRPGLAHFSQAGSSTEDFRSVIDDLTVANKKLKQKLKKYERVHDAHLQEDKLFEVRFHGLPDHKKKELEETLRKFAAELDDGPDFSLASSHMPVLEKNDTTFSSTSRFAESGYASMSASGQISSAPSNQASNQAEDRHKMSRSAYSRQQQSIRSYLHDIPVGLLPNSNTPMTGKAKKKMVVRRLEQIFAGKPPAPGCHPHPTQQEEVAQSAATADRLEREATGRQLKPEGLRVARIVPDHKDREHASGAPEAVPNLRSSAHVEEQDFVGSGSPDQRPTRPLELDPHRAQVPVENMDYIRHLGFTPPDMDTGEAPQDGHGWLYLNLLINMAQLHTLNVTPDFVKDALAEYSSHLELSHDGRKIRWKGGVDVTRNSSDSSSEHDSGKSPYEHGTPLKSLHMDEGVGSNGARPDQDQRARNLAQAQRQMEMNKFAYTPIFFQKEESDGDGNPYGCDVESPGDSLLQPQQGGNLSGFGSSAVRSGSSSKRRRDDGPIIFYSKAKFCTDLSGDRLGPSNGAPGAYKAATSLPLGATAYAHASSQYRSDLGEPRGPLDASPMDVDANSISRTVSSDEELGFSPAALSGDVGNDSPSEIMDFEASGLGGVQPEDNFSIRVQRSQTQTAHAGPVSRRRSSLYPRNILDALSGPSFPKTKSPSRASPQRVIKEEIISASRKSLPKSVLPPASFLPFDSTSSGDVDSDLDMDLESDVSSEADSESDDGPATALQLLNVSPSPDHQVDYSGIDSEEESEEYSDDSDDGSVDLLATARELDPKTVRSQEREYDAALADRLAEEIVAGSSAATAGGGSGFNSPSAGVTATQNKESSKEKRHSTTSGSMSSRGKLKRTRTSGSAGVKSASRIKKTKE